MLHAPCTFRGSGGKSGGLSDHRGGGDRHDPAERSSKTSFQDQGAFDSGADWTGDSVDSRRDIGQQTFYLERSLVASRWSFAGALSVLGEPRTTHDWRPSTKDGTELWLLQRISAFWRRKSANQGPRTPRGACASAEKFQLSCTARARARLLSRLIRGRFYLFCGRRAATTQFLTWRSTALGKRP